MYRIRTPLVLIVCVLALLCLGLVILASAAAPRGVTPYYFVKRQAVALCVGAAAAFALSRFSYTRWRKLAPFVVASAVLGLCLVLVPGIGVQKGGSRRWLQLRQLRLSVQPSEGGKFAAVVGLSAWYARIGPAAAMIGQGLVAPAGGLGVVLGLVMLEPDFGTTALTGMLGLCIMYVAGVRLRRLAALGAAGAAAFIAAIAADPVRLVRVQAILWPARHPGTAYHLNQSLQCFARGGLLGVGIGRSIQKRFFLPEAHTDFIFAIIGEELGLFAALGVIVLFICFYLAGVEISRRAPDRFGRLLAFGFSTGICLQAAMNIGVTTGCLPTKGIPLPFISYGGSSLVVTLCCVGVLLNIARHGEWEPAPEHDASCIRNRVHKL